jgi:hypothetical protein
MDNAQKVENCTNISDKHAPPPKFIIKLEGETED